MPDKFDDWDREFSRVTTVYQKWHRPSVFKLFSNVKKNLSKHPYCLFLQVCDFDLGIKITNVDLL